MPYRGCREGTWGKRLPQRHRNADFAAVAERRTDNVAGKSRRMADNVVQMIFVTFGARIRVMNYLLIILGAVSLGLGVAGMFTD